MNRESSITIKLLKILLLLLIINNTGCCKNIKQEERNLISENQNLIKENDEMELKINALKSVIQPESKKVFSQKAEINKTYDSLAKKVVDLKIKEALFNRRMYESIDLKEKLCALDEKKSEIYEDCLSEVKNQDRWDGGPQDYRECLERHKREIKKK
jgi:cell division protein FtsL